MATSSNPDRSDASTEPTPADAMPAAAAAASNAPAVSRSMSADEVQAALQPKPPRVEEAVRLASLGKGLSIAAVDDKTNDIVIRRSGRLIGRFADDKAIGDFAAEKKLSDIDREALARLVEARDAEMARRNLSKTAPGSPSLSGEPEFANGIERDPDKARARAEIERSDAEAYAWVERQKKARLLRAEPAETAPIEAAIAAERQAPTRPAESIEKESTFSSPNVRALIVPPELGARYVRDGDKFYHQANRKSVAFVDRGDRLDTPSSAPKMAETLVRIAEARGWEDLRVRGTEGFRREVWLEASVRGIHVDGYKPSELDKADLERRNTFTRDQNSIEVRSEAFQKLPPVEGVKRDPTLASAYGAEAAAKLFAERLHPENRAAFIQSVRDDITHKLERNEPIAIKLKVPEGQLVEHGQARYNFDAAEKPSYYVKLAESNGRERTYWGVGLQQAIEESKARTGDTLQLRVTESKGIVVEGNVRDAAGQVVGRKTVDAHRNEWTASVVEKPRELERQAEQERVR